MGRGEGAGCIVEVCAEAVHQARGEVVGALALLAEHVERAAESAAARKLVDAVAELEQAIADEAGERLAQVRCAYRIRGGFARRARRRRKAWRRARPQRNRRW